MRWLLVTVVVVAVGPILIVAPMVGMVTSSPWSSWWFMGATASPPGVVPLAAVEPPAGPLASDGSELMRAIQPWIGVPYLFAGNTRAGVDCSGLTFQVLGVLGYRFPWRTAQTQYDHVALVTSPQPGDLVFFRQTYASPDFITHVGFYVGSGWMISAAEPAVGRQSLSSPFWQGHFVGYGRVTRSNG
jgi:cell wall-associated NlpC family hydrolase